MRLANQRIVAVGAACLLAAAGLMGCNTTRGERGALVGGAVGAGTGAAIGSMSGHAGAGAAIGGAVGAITGGLTGHAIDESERNRPVVVQQAPPPPPPVQHGHYETRIVRTPSGEQYEERVWVPDR